MVPVVVALGVVPEVLPLVVEVQEEVALPGVVFAPLIEVLVDAAI